MATQIHVDGAGNIYHWNTIANEGQGAWELDKTRPYVDGAGQKYIWGGRLNPKWVPSGKVSEPASQLALALAAGDEEAAKKAAEAATLAAEKMSQQHQADIDVAMATFQPEALMKQPTFEEAMKAAKKTKKEGKEEKEAKKKAEMEEKFRKQHEESAKSCIYVTGLPPDVTMDELHEYFKQCGIIYVDADTDDPSIKIYKNEKGEAKGDALIRFFRSESVDLAIDQLDESELRPGVMVYVKQALFDGKHKKSKKKHALEKKEVTEEAKKKKKRAPVPKYKQQWRLLSWDQDQREVGSLALPHHKIVVLRNMFDAKESTKDPEIFEKELHGLLQKQCSAFGEIRRIKVFPYNTEGIVSIQFARVESADNFMRKMRGSLFSGRPVIAEKWNGKEKFDAEEKVALAAKFSEWVDQQEAPKE